MSTITGFSVKPATIIKSFGNDSDYNKGSNVKVKDLIETNCFRCFAELWLYYLNAGYEMKKDIERYLTDNVSFWEFDNPDHEAAYAKSIEAVRISKRIYAFCNPYEINKDKKYMDCLTRWNAHLFSDPTELKQNAETLSSGLKELEDAIVVSVGQDRSGRAAAMGMKQHNKSAEDLAKSIISIIEMDMDKSDILNAVNKAFGYPLGEDANFAKMSNDDLRKSIVNMIPSEEIMNKAIENNHTKVYGWIFDSLTSLAKQVKMADNDTDIMAIVADTIISILEKAKNDHFNEFAIICDRIRTKVIKYNEENIPNSDDEKRAETLIDIISDIEDKIDEIICDPENSISMAMAQKTPSEMAKAVLDITAALSHLVPAGKNAILDVIDAEKAGKFIKIFPSKASLVKAFKNPTLQDYAWLAEDIYDALDGISASKSDDEIIGIITSTLIKLVENAKVKHMSSFISICTKIKNRIAKAKAKCKTISDEGLSADDLNDVTAVVKKAASAAAMKQHHIPDEGEEANYLKNVIQNAKPQIPNFVRDALSYTPPKKEKEDESNALKLEMLIPEVQEIVKKFDFVFEIMKIAYSNDLYTNPSLILNASGGVDGFMFHTLNSSGSFLADKSFTIDNGTVVNRELALWFNVSDNGNITPFEWCNAAYRVKVNGKINKRFFAKLFECGHKGLNAEDVKGNIIHTSLNLETNRLITLISKNNLKDNTSKENKDFYTNACVRGAKQLREMINNGVLPQNIRFNIVGGSAQDKEMIISSCGVALNFHFDGVSSVDTSYKIITERDANGNIIYDDKNGSGKNEIKNERVRIVGIPPIYQSETKKPAPIYAESTVVQPANPQVTGQYNSANRPFDSIVQGAMINTLLEQNGKRISEGAGRNDEGEVPSFIFDAINQ